MPQAIAVVWEMLKKESSDQVKYSLLLDWDRVLGLDLNHPKTYNIREPNEEVKNLVEERERLRKEKRWEEADDLRKKIEKKGWLLEDTAEGPKLKPKINF